MEMIKEIRANKPSFKTVTLQKGFNVILADRVNIEKDKNNSKDSRNGSGKTTLIEIIHFCLGASVNKKSIMQEKSLYDWTFTIVISISGKEYQFSRNTKDPQKMYIDGDTGDWYIEPSYDKKQNKYYYNIRNFNECMGNKVFNLPIGDSNNKYTPSFRGLFSYLVRKSSGYQSPFMHFSQQKPYDIQVCNAFFLGLNSDYASKFQELKDRNKGIDNLKSAAKSGVLAGFRGTKGELNAEKVRLETDVKDYEEQLNTFKVHPQYEDLEKRANLITKKIHQISDDRMINKQLLDRYTESSKGEPQQDSRVDIETIYKEAGMMFGDVLKRSLDEVRDFHKSIVKNRKDYLTREIAQINRTIFSQDEKIKELSQERAELLEVLKTHGALQEYSKLQNQLTYLKQQLEEIGRRLEDYKQFEEGKSLLKIENEELLLKSRHDYDERGKELQKAIKCFNNNSQYLYSEPGALAVDINKNGYIFDVEIRRARSQGINLMKILCYDLMVAELGPERGKFLDFIIHDSSIFDGVDERQIAKALELAYDKTQEMQMQYICMLNSDVIPYSEFREGFSDILNKSIRFKMNDNTEDGGILGFRF